mgnify:CR=1 FL=1
MRLLLLLGLWLGLTALCAQDTLSLSQALDRGLIQVAMKGNGGHRGPCLHIWFKNRSNQALPLMVPPGTQFASQDSSLQDLLITAPALVTVPPRAVAATDLYAMCTQSFNRSPQRGAVFAYRGEAEGNLRKLAQQIADGHYQNGTAQCAVWAVVNGRGHQAIFGEDTRMVRALARTVSEANDVPLAEFDLSPRRHQLTNINTSFELLAERDLRDVRLRLYQPDGSLHGEYAARPALEAGFHQWTFGVNHTLGDTARLRMVLTAGETVIAERTIRSSDTVQPLQRYHQEAMLSFELDQPVSAEVGVYDTEGTLYFRVQAAKPLPRGFHRRRVIVGKDLPPGQAYFVQVRSGEQVLSSQPLRADAPAPTRHTKRRLRGQVVFELEQPLVNGTLALYDAQGRLKRKLYEIPRLNAGRKPFSYDFEHVAGPEAVFFLRLTDADGQVVAEKVVR